MSRERAEAIITVLNESETLSSRVTEHLVDFLSHRNPVTLGARLAVLIDIAQEHYAESIESIQPEGPTEDDLPLEAS